MKKIPFNDLVYYGSFSIIALLYALACAATVYAFWEPSNYNPSDEWETEENLLDASMWNGSYFSTENVYNYYETDSCFIVSYYGPEGFSEDIDIKVDEATYRLVENAVENGDTIVGRMNQEDDIFSFQIH